MRLTLPNKLHRPDRRVVFCEEDVVHLSSTGLIRRLLSISIRVETYIRQYSGKRYVTRRCEQTVATGIDRRNSGQPRFAVEGTVSVVGAFVTA